MSKHVVQGGDVVGLLTRLAHLQEKARGRRRKEFPLVVIQEAGLDGFWIHRVLEQEGIESHVVDSASIMTSRRRRQAKTDRIDGEALVRALLAYHRGEPRVCAIVRVPTPEVEDRRLRCPFHGSPVSGGATGVHNAGRPLLISRSGATLSRSTRA
jgi:transposase